MVIEVTCPNCAGVLALFDEEELATSKAIRRAYEHLMKDAVLCGNCNNWVEKPLTSRQYVEPAEDEAR